LTQPALHQFDTLFHPFNRISQEINVPKKRIDFSARWRQAGFLGQVLHSSLGNARSGIASSAHHRLCKASHSVSKRIAQERCQVCFDVPTKIVEDVPND
jgi:hypothetical protein